MDNPTNIIIISAVFAGIVIIALLVFFIRKRNKRNVDTPPSDEFAEYRKIQKSNEKILYDIIMSNNNLYTRIKTTVNNNSTLILPFVEIDLDKLTNIQYRDVVTHDQISNANINEIIDYILGLNYYNIPLKNYIESIFYGPKYYVIHDIDHDNLQNVNDDTINKNKFNKMIYTPGYHDSMYIIWYYLKIYDKPDSRYILLWSNSRFILIDIKYKIIYYISPGQNIKFTIIYKKNDDGKYGLLNTITGIYNMVNDERQKSLSETFDKFMVLGDEL